VVQILPDVLQVGLYLDLRIYLVVLLDVLQGFDEGLDLPGRVG
jgi:hypothetical protein